MEPEEIDKLFKNRLSNLPVPPSPDAWLRLQAKMEPPKKERTMWIYYVAASIVILLVSGLLLFPNYNPEPTAIVAQTEVKNPAKINSEKLPATQATPDKPVASTEETIVLNNPEKANTEDLQPAVKQDIFKSGNAVNLAEIKPTQKARKSQQVKATAKPIETEPEKNTTMVAQNKVTEPAEEKNTFSEKNSAAPGVVQVLVKVDDTAETTEADLEETSLRENISRKGILLKNIYKQARNLKNGEPVELATLGLNTEKINAEKENIKQKINKVISL